MQASLQEFRAYLAEVDHGNFWNYYSHNYYTLVAVNTSHIRSGTQSVDSGYN